MKQLLCRVLMVLVAWTPFQLAQAGMIDTGQAAVSASQVDRADVSSRLQSLGIDQLQAEQRVQAMSDQEVAALAAEIDRLPAGANAGGGLLAVAVIALIIWWIWWGSPKS